MTVKPLSVDNLNEIYNLSLEQFKNESWTLLQFKESLENPAYKFFGIFEDKALVCFASVLISLDDINLLDIATKDGFKRQGYAKTMLKYLLTQKKENQTFSLEVKSKNLPAIKLYESLGFKTLSVRKKYYHDGDDALCMFLN